MAIIHRIYGLECGDVIEVDGVSSDGGERKADEYALPGRDYGAIADQGRKPRTWKIKSRFETKAELEEWLNEVRTAPEGCECLPQDDDRSFYVAQADARGLKAEMTGAGTWLYRAEAKVVSKESCQYGANQGILYRQNVALPLVSDLLTNNGYQPSGLDYLFASGAYSGGSYTEDLSVRFTPASSTLEHDKELLLCDKLLVGDKFQVDRWGNVEHSFETSFQSTYAALQTALHGSAFLNYSTGGWMAQGALALGPVGGIWLSFYGPLRTGRNPVLELDISSLWGTPDVYVAYETDLSDYAKIVHDPLIVGKNVIPIPDCGGKGFLAYGVITGAGESVTLTRVKGTTYRYLAQSAVEELQFDPGETFKIRVEDSSNHLLRACACLYRDAYPI